MKRAIYNNNMKQKVKHLQSILTHLAILVHFFVPLCCKRLLLLVEQICLYLISILALYSLNLADCQDGWWVMHPTVPSGPSSSQDMYAGTKLCFISLLFVVLETQQSPFCFLKNVLKNIFKSGLSLHTLCQRCFYLLYKLWFRKKQCTDSV